MADPIFPKCEESPNEAHCWHTVYHASAYQVGQYDGHEMRCCWCGETRPLTATYEPPKAHGKHMPVHPNLHPTIRLL